MSRDDLQLVLGVFGAVAAVAPMVAAVLLAGFVAGWLVGGRRS